MERCRDDDNGDGTVATGQAGDDGHIRDNGDGTVATRPGTTGTSGTTGRRAQRGATRRVGHADAEGQDWPTGDDRSYGDAQWREGTAALATGAVRRPAATGTKGTPGLRRRTGRRQAGGVGSPPRRGDPSCRAQTTRAAGAATTMMDSRSMMGTSMAPGLAMRIAPRSAAETALTGSSGEERREVHRLNKREGTRFRRRG